MNPYTDEVLNYKVLFHKLEFGDRKLDVYVGCEEYFVLVFRELVKLSLELGRVINPLEQAIELVEGTTNYTARIGKRAPGLSIDAKSPVQAQAIDGVNYRDPSTGIDDPEAERQERLKLSDDLCLRADPDLPVTSKRRGLSFLMNAMLEDAWIHAITFSGNNLYLSYVTCFNEPARYLFSNVRSFALTGYNRIYPEHIACRRSAGRHLFEATDESGNSIFSVTFDEAYCINV